MAAETPQLFFGRGRVCLLSETLLPVLFECQGPLGQGAFLVLQRRSAAEPFLAQNRPFLAELFGGGLSGPKLLGFLPAALGPTRVQLAHQLQAIFGRGFPCLKVGQQAVTFCLPTCLASGQAGLPAREIAAQVARFLPLPARQVL